MTLLDEAPAPALPDAVESSPPRRGLPGWRVAVRLARRETCRRPGRTVLAGLLVAIPAAAMTLGSVYIRTDSLGSTAEWQFAQQYGSADLVVTAGSVPAPGTPPADAVLPNGTRTVDYVVLSTSVTPVGALSGSDVIFTDLPVDDPMLAGVIDLDEGHLPAIGELLLSADVARDWGVGVGDRLELARPAGSWTVAGLGSWPGGQVSSQLVLIPGFDRTRIADEVRDPTVLYDVPSTVDGVELDRLAGELAAMSRHEQSWGYDERQVLAWGWVGGVLAMVAVGIIVAAAFATSARRQLVTVGQLGANGAPAGTVRASLALQGTWTALAGGVVGVGAALAAVPFLRGWAEAWSGARLPSAQIAAFDLVAILLTAIVAGTVAAAVPARVIARTPIMSALAGRRPLGVPSRRLVPIGLLLFAAGLGMLAVAGVGARSDDTNSNDLWAAIVILGAISAVFGMVCATPLVIEMIGRAARRVPLSPRLAMRGMARSWTRSAAVVAAIGVAVAGAIAGATIAEHQLTNYVGPAYLPADTVLVQMTGYLTDCCDHPYDPAQPVAAHLTSEQDAALERLLPDAEREPLLQAVFDPPAFDPTQPDAQIWDGFGPMIATPGVIAASGLQPADIELLNKTGFVTGRDEYAPLEGEASAPSELLDDVVYPTESGSIHLTQTLSSQLPARRYGRGFWFLTAERAQAAGFSIVERGVMLHTRDPLTAAQAEGLEEVFGYGNTDWFVEPGDPPWADQTETSFWTANYERETDRSHDLWVARAAILAAALLLSGLVVAIGLALAAAEGRDERDVLTIVGATPGSMRRQAGARAAVLAITGIVLGIPTGFLPTKVLVERLGMGESGPPFRFPWLLAGTLVVLMPVFVATCAWAGSGIAAKLHPASPTRRD